MNNMKSNKKEFIIMKAIIFPGINILWTGCILMIIGSLLAIRLSCSGILRGSMQRGESKRRAIGILAVLGAILVMIATWNSSSNESN